MKRFTNRVFGKGILTIAVVSGVLIAGCNDNNDYNKEGEAYQMTRNDTMMEKHDTTMQGSAMTMNHDTTTTITTIPAGKDSIVMVNGGKTLKKGKVSIMPAAVATDRNTVMEMDKEGYYKNTEVLPAFPGGQKALERFFEDNIQYPAAATENDAQGVVKLIFSVDENGKIYQPLTEGDKIGYGMEEEAIRVFKKMPTWTPGKIKGKNVKTRYQLPVNFQLY